MWSHYHLLLAPRCLQAIKMDLGKGAFLDSSTPTPERWWKGFTTFRSHMGKGLGRKHKYSLWRQTTEASSGPGEPWLARTALKTGLTTVWTLDWDTISQSDSITLTVCQHSLMLDFFTQYFLYGKCKEQTSDCCYLNIFTARWHLDTKLNPAVSLRSSLPWKTRGKVSSTTVRRALSWMCRHWPITCRTHI